MADATAGSSAIERVLEQQGRSIRWLALQVDVDPSYAHRMIHGDRPVTPEFMKAASRLLGVPEDILFPVEPAEASA